MTERVPVPECACVYLCVSAKVVCVAENLATDRLRDSQRKLVLVQFTVNDSLPALHSPEGHWPTRFVHVHMHLCVCVLVI